MATSRRGPAVPLSRDRIIDAAVGVIDRDGVEALSMRKLGGELGVEAMALYHHFANKDALLGAVVGRVFGPGSPADPALSWADGLRAGAHALLESARAHPAAVPLLALRSPGAAESTSWAQGPLALARSAGMSDAAAGDLFHQVVAYAEGWVLTSLDGSQDPSRGFDEGLDAILAASAMRLPPGVPGAAPSTPAPEGGSPWIVQIEGGHKKGKGKKGKGKAKKSKK